MGIRREYEVGLASTRNKCYTRGKGVHLFIGTRYVRITCFAGLTPTRGAVLDLP